TSCFNSSGSCGDVRAPEMTAYKLEKGPKRALWKILCPRMGLRIRSLKSGNRGLLLHCQPDIIKPVQKAVALEGINAELQRAAIRTANLFGFKIDRQRRIGATLCIIKKLVEICLTDRDRQDPILEAVVIENVGETGGDHAANAEIKQRPWRMFARGTATE